MSVPLFLGEGSVDADSGEILFGEKLGECHTSLYGPDEDNNLVELQQIQKVEQFPVLLALLQFYVVLLESVEGEFGFVVHENFQSLVVSGV